MGIPFLMGRRRLRKGRSDQHPLQPQSYDDHRRPYHSRTVPGFSAEPGPSLLRLLTVQCRRQARRPVDGRHASFASLVRVKSVLLRGL
jgi:hypothetical protein